MKLDPSALRQAIVDIDRIADAGRLEELCEDFAAHAEYFIRTEDLENCTLGKRLAVEQLAKVAAKILGEPYELCLEAATAVSVPTRQQVMLDLIASHIAELDGTTPVEITTTGTPSAIERARRQAK